ncbi:hypothetical protein CCYA_CCYA15G3866 [Cyanidiococcus yangmingshanensis]|nr:hypothetical protein CCYA_CCYA08G2486 [Cyanidiococcus yangmingshanensis]KAK4533009.1 hypothetical protein CCYA_CCYA15G3866 [Cyanidiococcus yangmingshanensis]
MQFQERDCEATAVPDADLTLVESTVTRLETFVRSTSAPDWCRVRAELASTLAQTSQRRVPDSLRLRVWNLALESPQPTTIAAAASVIERQPYNEPAPDDEADDILFTAEPPREQGVNSDALALVSPNRAVSGAALMKDTEELASTSETAEYLDGTAARHGPLAPTSQQPQQPGRPENASPAFMNCSADEAELDVPPANADDSTLDQSPTATCAALMSDTFAVLEQDVMRTRRGLAAFERPATRARLTLWLCAFCDEHGVPYMQGMNEIAAVFVYLHETLHADATTCACYAMYKRFAERYVPLAVDPAEDPFGRLKQAFRLFNDLLWFHDPEVASRLERYQLSTDMYATAWLVTVFARNLAMETVLVLWDVLLLVADPLLTIFVALVSLVSSRQSLLISNEATLPEQLLSIPFQSRQDMEAAWQWARKLAARTPNQALDRARATIFASKPTKSPSVSATAEMIEFEPTEVLPPMRAVTSESARPPLPVLLLDCRPADERQFGLVPQAILLDLDELRDAVLHGWRVGPGAAREDPLAQRLVQHVLERIGSNQDGKCWICLVGSGPPTYFDIDENEFDVSPLRYLLQHVGIHYVAPLRRGFTACEALSRSGHLSLPRYDPTMLAQVRQAKCARLVSSQDRAAAEGRPTQSTVPDWRLDQQLSQALGVRRDPSREHLSTRSLAIGRWLESDQTLFAKDTPLELASPSLLRRLALYPCLKLQRKTGTFVRRYLGVSKRRLFVLAPDRGRNTTFFIKSSRSLVLLRRILFRKETRELVVFEFRSATSQAIDKRITCHLPDGLSECIDCIRNHLKLIKVQMRLQRRTTDRSNQEQGDAG